MTATSHASGHRIVHYNGAWRWAGTGKAITMRACKHCGRETRMVLVLVPANLSYSGQERWAWKPVDACIADTVEALQKAGVNMRASCCGHGQYPGDIHLADGTVLDLTEAMCKRS